MDIMMPPLKQQPSPAPWLRRRERIDLARFIDAALALQPEAGIDDVVAQLGRWGIQVSGIVISMWMSGPDRPPRWTKDGHSMQLNKASDEFRRSHRKQELHWANAT
jgi:hypothetical protein